MVDSRLFRDVAGRFATGVTVVTWRSRGAYQGLTANAVSALSLEPTLFLVCIDDSSSKYSALSEAGRFAVNVLAADQEEVSRFFAQSTPEQGDPMGGFAYRTSDQGSPLLDGALAWLDCTTQAVLDGGDHKIFIGAVEGCAIEDPVRAPLLFYGGEYREIRPE